MMKQRNSVVKPRKNYLCLCEGKQEIYYVKRINALLAEYSRVNLNPRIARVKKSTREKLKIQYDAVAIFDHDGKQGDFDKAVCLCERWKRKTPSLCHGYSNMSFDLWLILHKQDYQKPVTACKSYHDVIRCLYFLDKDADIKEEKIIKRIMDQISLDDVKRAIARAEYIRESKVEVARKNGNYACYENPDFSIHLFVKHLLEICAV